MNKLHRKISANQERWLKTLASQVPNMTPDVALSVRRYLDALKAAHLGVSPLRKKGATRVLKIAKERDSSPGSVVLLSDYENSALTADTAAADAATPETYLIGEMRENGVNWFNQNPHAHPLGTKFYADKPPAATDS